MRYPFGALLLGGKNAEVIERRERADGSWHYLVRVYDQPPALDGCARFREVVMSESMLAESAGVYRVAGA
jgi:hypothetical protein